MLTLEEVLDRYTAVEVVESDERVHLAARAAYDAGESKEKWQEFVAALAGEAPLMLALGDRAATHGDFDLALESYAAVVRQPEEDVPQLAQTGRSLLRRARSPLAPIDNEGWEYGPYLDMGFLDIGFVTSEGPLFPQAYARELTALATEAFARAIQALCAAGDPADEQRTLDDLVQTLLCLDGLRCGLLLLGDTEALDAVLNEVVGLGEAWEHADEQPFVAQEFTDLVSDTRTWLRGRRGEPFWGASDGTDMVIQQTTPDAVEAREPYDRLAVWQNRQILEILRDLKPDLVREIVAGLNRIPGDDSVALDEKLSRDFGDRWAGLPAGVRRNITQAERLRPVFAWLDGIDWAPVVSQYGRALELLLHDALRERLVVLVLRHRSGKQVADASRLADKARHWSAGDFAVQIQHVAAKAAQPDAARVVSRALDAFAHEYRNPASHGGEFIDPARARDARESLLGPDGLAWRIQALRL